MRATMTLIFLTTISNTLWAADFGISSAACEKLAVKSSIVTFSTDNNGIQLRSANLHKKLGALYIKRVRDELYNELKSVCKSDSIVSFSTIKNKLHSSCSNKCQDHKDMLEKSKRLKADSICLSLCNKAYKNLEYVELGYSFNKCLVGSSKNTKSSNKPRTSL